MSARPSGEPAAGARPWRRALGLTLVALVLAGCGGASHRTAPSLVDADSVFTVKAAFNADRGSPRLLVVLSPT
jgi:hypothetical protein